MEDALDTRSKGRSHLEGRLTYERKVAFGCKFGSIFTSTYGPFQNDMFVSLLLTPKTGS